MEKVADRGCWREMEKKRHFTKIADRGRWRARINREPNISSTTKVETPNACRDRLPRHAKIWNGKEREPASK